MANTPAAPPRPTKADRIADELRRRLAMGEYAPGAFLPPERELADQLSTSRKTIADAMHQLCEQGLVTRAVGRGTQVVSMLPSAEPTTIRVVHPLRPKTNLVWGEAIEVNRGINEALAGVDARIEQHCWITGQSAPHGTAVPPTLCPTVFHESPMELLDHMEELQRADIPFVLANLERRDLPYSATWVNHADAMRQAVELLINLGHRRIAYIGSPSSHLFYGEAERGYTDALRDAGIGVDCALITRHRAHGIPQVIAGQHMGHRLMQMTERPTAIVAARDAFAEGAWYAIEEHGLTVGRDVSLVGYDDHSASAHCRELTTFHEPCYELGAKAVEMLVDRIVNNHTTLQQVELKSKLVMRRSAGPVNN